MIQPTPKSRVAVAVSNRFPRHPVISFTEPDDMKTTSSFVLTRDAAEYLVAELLKILAR